MSIKKKNTVVNLTRTLAPILGSRDVVNDLKQLIVQTPTKRVDLDFQKVQFISRSAAHELLRIKEELLYRKENRKEIKFINTNKDVTQMLRVVASNRAMPKKEIPELKLKTVNINSLIL